MSLEYPPSYIFDCIDESKTENEISQSMKWILCSMEADEEEIYYHCQKMLKLYPYAASIPDRNGEYPIHYSCKRNLLSTTELLLNYYPHGASERSRARQYTDNDDFLDESLLEEPHDVLPIHCLVKERRGECIEHIQCLIKAYPEGLLEQTSEGHTPLHISAIYGETQSFLELLKWNTKAASIRDIEGNLPIDILLHPYDIPYDRFGSSLSDVISQLIQVDTENSIQSTIGWLEEHYIIGLCPSLDVSIGFHSLTNPTYSLSLKHMLALQEMMSTLIHSVYEYRMNQSIFIPNPIHSQYKFFLHRALSIPISYDTLYHYWFIQQCYKQQQSYPKYHSLNYSIQNQIHERDLNGNLPIHIASTKSTLQIPILMFLIHEDPYGLQLYDKKGNLPLHLCIEHHCSLEAMKLIYHGYPPALLRPTMRSDQYQYFLPLHIAASINADMDIIYFLIQMCPHIILNHSIGGN